MLHALSAICIIFFHPLDPIQNYLLFFFFNDTPTTEIYTLSLHDALPISTSPHPTRQFLTESLVDGERSQSKSFSSCARRSEERFSRNAEDWFRYESHFVHGRDSLVDILKERALLSESDAVQPLRSEERFSRN